MPGVTFARGERVTLHTAERDDAAFYQRGRNHPELRDPMGLADPTNVAQVEESIEDGVERDDTANLLVCLPPDASDESRDAGPESDDAAPTPIGAVNAWDLGRPRGQVSYWLLQEYHGEGYATEAMGLFLDHLFDARETRGVEARVFSHNDASQALFDRLGFEREGKLREANFVEGAYRDEYVYGLLREEWVG
ncbi:GNAT family N-acetyltransferase [Halorussus litoreus]|uniref:GNAT family N-acetyltransferase n=1 Tax=Halorussus litoreus TaxID=1710536 RepID=UPI000E24CA32|nr:GNAT family protein [Halorussus litoreus]